MNCTYSNKYVQKIIDSKDNIIDQLKELSKFKYRKEVRQYIDRLILTNSSNNDFDSKYILYCIVKYYYDLEVQDSKEPSIIPKSLDIITPADYDMDFIADLLDSKDNIVDQCKLLKEHQDSIDVKKYISCASTYYGYDAPVLYCLSTEYEMYCINKYFYGYDVPLVKSNHVRLGVWIKTQTSKKSNLDESIGEYTPYEDVKKGDKIKIFTGPFKNLQATIDNIDLDNNHIEATINLFDQNFSIELTEDDRILKEDNHHE